jgi:hypothetical protein
MTKTTSDQIKQFHLHFRAKGPVVRMAFTDFTGQDAFYYPRISGGIFGLEGGCCRLAETHLHGVDLFVLASDTNEALSAARVAMAQVWIRGFGYLRTDLPKPISGEEAGELAHGVTYMGEERLKSSR